MQFFSGSNMEIFRIDYGLFPRSIMNFGSTIEKKMKNEKIKI